MEIELSDVAGLPEQFKGFVAEKDGKHVLSLATAAAEFDKAKGKALTAQQEAIDRRKALEAWGKLGETPDAVAAKLAAGADPKIIDQMRTQHAQELAQWKERFTGTVRASAVAGLKGELAKAGVVPEGLDLLATYAQSRMQFDDAGNVRIMAKDGGTPMVGSGADGGATLADLAAELAKSIPHLLLDRGAGGGGKPAGSAGTAGQKTMTRAQFNALTPQGQADAMKSGVKLTD